MSKSIVNEIFWLRAIACLSVVLLHSITKILSMHETSTFFGKEFFESVRLMLMFATPSFVFIAEFLIAKLYPEKLPTGFFASRIKFLLIPYVAMGILQALASSSSVKSFVIEAFKNVILANYSGYFIIIIFQFYILHYLFANKLNNWNPKKVLLFSFLINVAYIAFFNFVKPPDLYLAEYIWYRFSWYPFFGWLFIFIVAFYCGKNYSRFTEIIKSNKYKVFGIYIISLLLLIFADNLGYPDIVSSKRLDVLLHTFAVIFLVFLLTERINKVPKIIMFISKYAFSIYLLHPFFMIFIPENNALNPITYIFFTFFVSVLISIITSKILNKFKYGKYLVGRIPQV